MKSRFTLFRRGRTYYCQDATTGKQTSLRTKDKAEAVTLLGARNEANRQPQLNLQLARTYLSATDPESAKRDWQVVMDAMGSTKHGVTLRRHECAMRESPFDLIRKKALLATKPEDFVRVLEVGSVSTNIFLRRLHNFALDMDWLPQKIFVKRRWPKIVFREKRAITLVQHQAIIANEHNPERRAYYECCWHLGGAQTDVANLKAEDIDWSEKVVAYARQKCASKCRVRIGPEFERVLRSLPAFGPLFPNHRLLTEGHRAKEFWRACRRVKVTDVSLHCYRYAWAERAKISGYPERFAQEALGHQSKAVHRAYSRKADLTLPALEDYEKKHVAEELQRASA